MASKFGPVDEIAAALAFHDGDVRARAGTMLADIKLLEEHLADRSEQWPHSRLAAELRAGC